MILSNALAHARPGAQWTLTNEDLSTLEWVGPGEPPTLAELQIAWDDMQQINNFQNAIYNGFQVDSEGFVLGLQESDRNAFSQMLGLVKEALDLGLITNDSLQTIADKNGVKHTVSTLRFRQIMVQYGMYYKSLWDQYITNPSP